MALVAVDAGAQREPAFSGSLAADAVRLDETAWDLLRSLRASRGSGLACLDTHLPGGSLGPGELVVVHGAAGAAKSALLRSLLAAYVARTERGGHGLPAVLLDADRSFDAGLMARVLEARGEAALQRRREAGLPDEPELAVSDAEAVEEALGRLLVLRPDEPQDLLRQLRLLRDVLAANPAVALLVVDSMSAWQTATAAFPKAAAPFVRESWRALERLQREHCVAVVVALREGSAEGADLRCRHLAVAQAWLQGPDSAAPPLEGFALSPAGPRGHPAAPAAAAAGAFVLSGAGEVVSIDAG